MKRYFTAITFSLLALFMTACKKDDYTLNTNLKPVERLTAPVNNKFTKLQPATSAAVSFEWDQARAEDGSLVLYEVVFDKESGDFSAPLARIASDGGGIQNKLTLSHKDLNTLAAKAGIPALGLGKLKWNVSSSKGFNIQPSTETRTIELERPAGFAEIPVDVFLTGTATEAGDATANALQMKMLTAGVFEIYTSLKDGTFEFIDRKTGTPNNFYMDGELLKEKGKSTHAGGTKAIRIRLDFNNATATATEILSIGLWFAPDDKFLFETAYAGAGKWGATDKNITFRQESWGRDERYKFRMRVKNAAGTESDEWIGSSNQDNNRPTSTTPPSFYELKAITNNDRWNYCYKFKTEVDTKNCDVNLFFYTDKNYTHEIIIK
ncbi:SusE domain-containing protein [Chitinophaga barathri]|uniref:SusE outer membrane protein domain-containing protein n=1 Tax=Chitinophaga barathri TaxID=1647451 RepID=A0A3N4MWU9_9BACT|nr:SusE domain-containing protein [Chitinophaga barathri]RPD39873.1 hypothetical protein EG028_17245 [Chitinophaga barathri]